MKNIHAFTKKIGNRPPQIGIFSSSEAAFSRTSIESWLFTVTISCERTGQTKEMFRVESMGKPRSVSEEHFPGREKLARFPRNISPGGKTLPRSWGTFSQAGKACPARGEHFPGRGNLAALRGRLSTIICSPPSFLVRPRQGVCDTPLQLAAKNLHETMPPITASPTNK